MRGLALVALLVVGVGAAKADDCEILLKDPELFVEHAREAIKRGDRMIDGKLTPNNQCMYDRVPQWVDAMLRHCKAGWSYRIASALTKKEIFGPCYPGGWPFPE